MKKFCTIFFTTVLLIFSFIVAEASSIQKPALWPAIKDIELTNDGGYIFTVNVRAYCPNGIEGDLLVAAYNTNNRLLDVAHRTVSFYSSKYPLDNRNMETFLDATRLAEGIELKLKEKDNVIIKAFVISLDTLKPAEIESGGIEFIYDGADSYVNVDYTLKSDYTDVQLENSSDLFYYYYYYDGEYDEVKIFFHEDCKFDTERTFHFLYYNKITFDNISGRYYQDELANVGVINCTEIPGIKIANYLTTARDRFNDNEYYYLTKYGFETNGITVYCDFSKLN